MKLFASLLILALSLNLFAVQNPKLHFVHLNIKDKANLAKIANLIHIDEIIETSAYSVVNDFDFKQLKKVIPSLIIETHPVHFRKPLGPTNTYEYPAGDEKFHTYLEVESSLNELAKKYPKITELFDIGSSVEGRKISGIRITAPDLMNTKAFIPGILFMGSHHAREHLSTEVPMLMIKYLLENYEKDERVKNLISNRDIYFIPMINPDGAMHDIKGRRYKMWRKNRAINANSSRIGVDLNRNYSFGWGTGGSSKSPGSDVYMGPKPFSEPETQGVREFVDAHPNLRAVLSFHTYSELILYPWGGKRPGIGGKDQKVFETMARKMATWNGYKPMQASGLYVASGDTCDWAYGEKGLFCFTFELTPKSRWRGGFYPGAKVIEKTFQANIKPILYLIEKAAAPYSVLESKI